LEHTDQINAFASALAKEPEKRRILLEHIRSGKSSFASRVTTLGFAPEQLEVYTLDVKRVARGAFSDEDLENLAAVLEWFLNRWHRPIAGRI
jgi:hypothetical protein